MACVVWPKCDYLSAWLCASSSCCRSRSCRRSCSAAAQTPEATSLFGKPLVSATPTGEEKARLEANLARAQADYDRDPASADAAIWLGRRLAYLGRFRDAIDVYTRGIARHPNEPRLYRHRGHRYITIRKFDLAIADLRRASQLTPASPTKSNRTARRTRPGFREARCSRTSGITSAWRYYLANDFEQALAAYREGMKVSRVNDDMLVATSDWLYMTLRRLKRDAEARQVLDPIREQMDVLENGAYHARLLMYKGLRTPDSVLNLNTADDVQIATQGYGVGNWYLVNGDREESPRGVRTGPRREGVGRVRLHRGGSGCEAWFLSRRDCRSSRRSAARRSSACAASSSPAAPTSLVKLEYYNPTGSYKDRMALAMIEGAEARGALKPGMRVVEFTGGSTGSSLALVCAVKGYRFIPVSSDAFAKEKLDTMRAFGGELIVVASDGGRITPPLFDRMRAEVHRLLQEPGTFWTDQFNNEDAHYRLHGHRPRAGGADRRRAARVLRRGRHGGDVDGRLEGAEGRRAAARASSRSSPRRRRCSRRATAVRTAWRALRRDSFRRI